MTRFLTLADVERVCFEYARARLTHDEPIPSFDSRFPSKLESAIEAPQRSYDGKLLYETFERQAALLFYELIKLHPFLNGNKRIATVSLMVFLSLNGKWIKTEWKELYDIAITVAESKPENRDGILGLLEEFIKNKIVPA
ncbi:type II toxin-antitoxin system death-on-curing family toxin [Candidatus Azambacteria bacterium]|nr:type II toxin-antitoxin system death-on-curing family toxin [Candidatus Azambacteria bacterium]